MNNEFTTVTEGIIDTEKNLASPLLFISMRSLEVLLGKFP